ncbi:hypothetical protein BDK51DRAFT_48505 [Blyttiomyces helicus]|uniref:Uncharacterized protein n=1 Tax=Blyttiomyces helicus TaxID=388810 RepID=A0A4P9VZ49_9FUNG|nr:hypothetical protein BDK51DRAFT_48505 [Blyttiomyces helicus]|eukprot:RKO84582.1 hypothetical protein BDK51DRAFT_48505 [Blyttiomyces helicus]
MRRSTSSAGEFGEGGGYHYRSRPTPNIKCLERDSRSDFHPRQTWAGHDGDSSDGERPGEADLDDEDHDYKSDCHAAFGEQANLPAGKCNKETEGGKKLRPPPHKRRRDLRSFRRRRRRRAAAGSTGSRRREEGSRPGLLSEVRFDAATTKASPPRHGEDGSGSEADDDRMDVDGAEESEEDEVERGNEEYEEEKAEEEDRMEMEGIAHLVLGFASSQTASEEEEPRSRGISRRTGLQWLTEGDPASPIKTRRRCNDALPEAVVFARGGWALSRPPAALRSPRPGRPRRLRAPSTPTHEWDWTHALHSGALGWVLTGPGSPDTKLCLYGMGLEHRGFDEWTDAVKRDQQRGAPKRKKPAYKTAEELLAAVAATDESTPAPTAAPQKIIDMTGPTALILDILSSIPFAPSTDSTSSLPE